MPLEFLQQTPEQAFRKIEQDLRLVSIDLTKYKRMTPRQLGEAVSHIDSERARVINETTYGKWLESGKFSNAMLLREALEFLKEHKEAKAAAEVLIPGFSYYRGMHQYGDRIQGEKCYFIESATSNWVSFVSTLPVEKSLLLLEHGTEEDFRKIYIEMADGRIDALEHISIEHIAESSDGALSIMETYCDKQWNGSWPWETPAPLKLHMQIQDTAMKKNNTIQEMKGRFAQLTTRLREGEMDRFEVILAAREMTSKIQSMIEDLGKLSGEGLLTLKDNTRSAFGDHAAQQIDSSMSEPLNAAADMLSQLRASMEGALEQLEGGADTGAGIAGAEMTGDNMAADAAMGGDMPPAPPMGGAPGMDMGGDVSPAAIADVDIDGEEVERPKKEL